MNWRFAVWNVVAIAIGGAAGYGVGVATRSPLQGIISGFVVAGLAWLAYRWFPNAEHASTDSSTSPVEIAAAADAKAQASPGQVTAAQRGAGVR